MARCLGKRSWVCTAVGVHVKLPSYVSVGPKTEKRSLNFLSQKYYVKALILNSFWAGKGYPPTESPDGFLIGVFST